MARFLETLHSGRVLLMDGALGTELQRAGMPEGACHEAWNIEQPDRVKTIHRAYVDAGSEILLTNTFQANATALAQHGWLDRLELLLRTGLDLARSIAGPHRFVLADLGPLATPHPEAEVSQIVKAIPSPDAFLVETATDLDDATALVNCLRDATEGHAPPVLLSFTFARGTEGPPRTFKGWSPEECARRSQALGGIAGLGVNCGREIGMAEVIEVTQRYRSATDLPLFARPNAGTPVLQGQRWTYPHTPAQMAARLPELLRAGASMVGGCCGTTPEHIRAFRRVIDDWNRSQQA